MTAISSLLSPAPDIGRLEDAGDVPALIRCLDLPDPAVRWRAAEALGRSGKKAIPPLLAALRSRSPPVRLGAIEALEMIRSDLAVGPLLSLIGRERSMEVTWAAVLALGGIGSTGAVPSLVPLLRNPDRYLRLGAALSLERLGWQPGDDAERAYLLIAHQDWEGIRQMGAAAVPPLWDLLRDSDPGTRARIAAVLGRIGDPLAAPACQKALRDRDPRVRWKAVLASMDCGLASHDLPLMVAGRERTGPDPAAAAILNFLFLGIGYNYIGKWWGFPVFMGYMTVIVLAQFAVTQSAWGSFSLGPFMVGPLIPYFIAYPITAVLGIHTYFLAEKMSDL